MDQIIDQAWASLLASVMKRRSLMRPMLGDNIDLYFPQSRLLSLVESNPDIPKLLYLSAYSSAGRNAQAIVKKLGMPADYFWKFEYWPKARAQTTLGQIVKRIFSSMMAQAKEGNLEITGLDIDPLRINITFSECAECAGISGLQYGICYYHAGCFAGIIAALINRELDAFETDCCAKGDQSCKFVQGDRMDKDIKAKYESYISPVGISTNLSARLDKSLNNLPVRGLGNQVDINYHQLIMANALQSDPQHLAPVIYEVGSKLGHKLAPVVAGFYKQEETQNIGNYYLKLGEFRIEVSGDKSRLAIAISECAETAGPLKIMEMMSFLFGELQGLLSELTGTEMALKENHFEGDKLLLNYIPKT